MSLATNIIAKILATDTTPSDVGNNVTAFVDRDPIQLGPGVGTNQADRMWSDTRTLAASTSEELDLNALNNNIPLSNINMATVKAILVVAADGNTNNVEIGNAAATIFQAGFGATGQKWIIPPGGIFLATSQKTGWPSTNGVSDKLKIANSGAGTSVDYTIYLIGCSS